MRPGLHGWRCLLRWLNTTEHRSSASVRLRSRVADPGQSHLHLRSGGAPADRAPGRAMSRADNQRWGKTPPRRASPPSGTDANRSRFAVDSPLQSSQAHRQGDPRREIAGASARRCHALPSEHTAKGTEPSAFPGWYSVFIPKSGPAVSPLAPPFAPSASFLSPFLPPRIQPPRQLTRCQYLRKRDLRGS